MQVDRRFGDLGFKVYGLGLYGLGFEASGSREVGLGGIGVRRSGVVVRHIDFQIGETLIYEFTNSQS